LFFLIWSIRATVLYRIDEAIPPGDWLALYSNGVKLLIWVVPAVLFAWFAAGENPLRYLGLVGRFSAKNWLVCLSILTMFLGAIFLVETNFGGKHLLFPSPPAITIGGIGFYLISPTLEEVLFRGLIQNELQRRTSNWSAILLTSILFVGIHLPHWLWRNGFSIPLAANCVGVFLFSLLAGWIFLRGESLWLAILAHIANNTLASVLVSK
jgi:membrane protease YdiL (CAAX protease family)